MIDGPPAASEAAAYSVGMLLRQRIGQDRWNLALVQRDEVWDVDRMRRLLDSLLAGYPIGALLLCRTTQGSKVVVRDETEAEIRDAGNGEWQLLDGQQRINALYTMLCRPDKKREAYGRCYLDLTAERQPPSGSAATKAMPYLIWRRGPDGRTEEDLDDFDGRSRCVDLTRCFEWAEAHTGDPTVSPAESAQVAAALDPQFSHCLSAAEQVTAADWLTRLLSVWTKPLVPVMRAEVGAPEDLLELFARLNRGGVPFRDADIYYAAVKTFWNDAEPSLDRVVRACSLADEVGAPIRILTTGRALRLISRLASRGIGRGDAIPLRVERIAGEHREAMVEAMTRLTAPGSTTIHRLEEFVAEFGRHTTLGYAVRSLSHHLWDEVLGWAVTAEAWSVADFKAIDTYLLGATLFSYPTTLGTGFRNLAFVQALNAGTAGATFPLVEILGATRQGYPGLRRSRQVVFALEGGEGAEQDRRRLEDRNAYLLLCLAQRFPLGYAEPLDLDHIYPSALGHRMRRGRQHHPHRKLLNSLGNWWLLDAGANRSLQDDAPEEKFRQLIEWLEPAAKGHSVREREAWAIEDGEIETFQAVHRRLKAGDVEPAMEMFADLVTRRAARILQGVLDEHPDVVWFARDDDTHPEPFEATHDTVDPSLPARLGLADVADRAEKRVSSRVGGTASTDTGSQSFGDDADPLESAFDEATRRACLSAGALRANPRMTRNAHRFGFRVLRWVPVGARDGTHVAVGVVEDPERHEETPIWGLLSRTSPDFELARDALMTARGALDEDACGIWMPLRVDRELPQEAIATELYEQIVAVGEAIMTSPAATED